MEEILALISLVGSAVTIGRFMYDYHKTAFKKMRSSCVPHRTDYEQQWKDGKDEDMKAYVDVEPYNDKQKVAIVSASLTPSSHEKSNSNSNSNSKSNSKSN